jgi:hypothetical protein
LTGEGCRDDRIGGAALGEYFDQISKNRHENCRFWGISMRFGWQERSAERLTAAGYISWYQPILNIKPGRDAGLPEPSWPKACLAMSKS